MSNLNVALSIITPFYDGNNVIEERLRVVENIALQDKNKLFEWIIINDSPNINIKKLSTSLNNLIIKEKYNTSNLGIHHSRINGFNLAKGKFITFLDQDDYLDPTFFKKQTACIKKADVCICNGFNENSVKIRIPIFKNNSQMKMLEKISTYFYLGNLIVSPGMAIIRKNAVPKEWLKNIMRINGADDWLLWVSLLANRKRIVYCNEKLYIHVKTLNNTSDDDRNMLNSCREALTIFINNHPKYLALSKVYNKRLCLWQEQKVEGKNKYFEYFKNPSIALRQFNYRIKGMI